jgi:radical SAM protein with 4Fe4S-binding SPASM domain
VEGNPWLPLIFHPDWKLVFFMASLLDRVQKRYRDSGRIISVVLEVTHKCPCSCEHCYLRKDTSNELSTEEICDLLDQLKEEGVINLTITGGDPLARKDLDTILARARDHQFFVYLLTTGFLLDAQAVQMLKRNGVRQVELSLHGTDAFTHDAVMVRTGSFDRMQAAARFLVAAGIQVRFNSTITRCNHEQLHGLRELATNLGGSFGASASVAPHVDGSLDSMSIALSEEQVAQLDPTLLDGGLIPGETGSPGALLKCNAGVTAAGIGPRGEVYPCIIFRKELGNIRDNRLADIWRDNPNAFLESWRNLKQEEVAQCHSCEDKKFCRRCPGTAFLETRSLTAAQPSACTLARGMKKAWENHSRHSVHES